MENKKEKMFKFVEQWQSSGLSQKKFAAKHSIEEKTFAYWCTKHLHEVRGKQIHKDPFFIELPLQSNALRTVPQLHMELELPEGVRIKIYR